MWARLPETVRASPLGRRYGGALHARVCREATRRQYFGTFFLRNRPLLEQIRRLAAAWPPARELRLAVLGCSSGAEVYSVAWTLRRAHPGLRLRVLAADVAPEILEVARNATYADASSQIDGHSIFERLSPAERETLFDWNGALATVKPWIRRGIEWLAADAGEEGLRERLGAQDIVIASNFLCHMDPPAAERCLRNLARLVAPGGHLFVLGVDLDVRARVAADLHWQPLPELLREMHDGDPSVRRDWPWNWWGLEPLDHRRADWPLRYAIAYRLP